MTEVKNCRIQPKKNIYKPLFHQIFKTSKQREQYAIQRVLRKYYKLKTYSKPLHLILTSNFPYILNNDQSKYSKRCSVKLYKWKEEAKSLPVIRRKKVWFVAYVRNPTQCSHVNFLTNHYQARAANPRKQPEKLGWGSGVFSGALRNAFWNPRNSPEKSHEKSSGPRSFRVFWETHARPENAVREVVSTREVYGDKWRIFRGQKFSGALRNTRKSFRELCGAVSGPEKFSGLLRNARLVIFDWFVLSMCMQVILDSSFARPGSVPIWGGKKVEFRDWTSSSVTSFYLTNKEA